VRNLSHQRCFNHGMREAVARCPECHRCFCRECITEHDDRVICASCLKKLALAPFTRRSGFLGVVRAVQVLAGVVIAWFFFYAMGYSLLRLPSSFHDGTLWKGY
jgi:hypothetical protein